MKDSCAVGNGGNAGGNAKGPSMRGATQCLRPEPRASRNLSALIQADALDLESVKAASQNRERKVNFQAPSVEAEARATASILAAFVADWPQRTQRGLAPETSYLSWYGSAWTSLAAMLICRAPASEALWNFAYDSAASRAWRTDTTRPVCRDFRTSPGRSMSRDGASPSRRSVSR